MNKPNIQHYIIDTPELFDRLTAYADKVVSDVFVLDVETDSKIEKIANLYGIGVCFNENKAFYIVWRDKNGNEIWSEEMKNKIKNWIIYQAEHRKLTGHNIIYDILVLENENLDLTDLIYSDTILQKHTLDEEKPFALKEISVKLLGEWADKAQDKLRQEVISNGGSWNNKQKDMYLATTKTLGEYCCWDVILTYLLFKKFEQQLTDEKLFDFFYNEEVMPLYKEVTIPMKRRGFAVDLKHFEQLKIDIQREIGTLENSIYNDVKDYIKDFEQSILDKLHPPKPKGKFPKIYAEQMGIPLPKNKKTGNVTLAAKALEEQKEATPLFKDFYDWVIGANPNYVPENCSTLAAKVLYSQTGENPVVATQKAMFFEKNPDHKTVFNLRSNDHLIELFFNIWGLSPLSKTEKGKPQIDDKFLESQKGNPVVDKLIDLKKLNKMKSTYIEGILDRQVDGVLYTSLLQFGTTSGRYSSRNPNLQNLPRPIAEKDADEAGISLLVLHYVNAIRKGLCAPKGYKIVDADYSSLEPRCFAHVSGDSKLQNVFIKGEDLYSRIAIDVFKLQGVSADPINTNYLKEANPEFRQKAKVFCFTENTLVETGEGYKSIKDIKVGDYVGTVDGSNKVTHLFNREAKVVEFITNKGGFKCTEDHKIWSLDRNTWIEAKNFKEGEKLQLDIERKLKNENLQEDQFLPVYSNAAFKNGAKKPISYVKYDADWAWILGAYLGDGIGSYTNKKERNKRNFNSHLISSYTGICGLKEDKVVKKYTKILGAMGYKLTNKTTYNKKTGKDFSINICSDFELTKIFQDTFKAFAQNGLDGRKNLAVQDFVMNSNLQNKLAFLAGLLDTDGYLKSNKNKEHSDVSLCSKEFDLISGISMLLHSIGINHGISLDWNTTYKKYYYIVRIYQNGIYDLASLGIQNYMCVPRKIKAFKDRLKIFPRGTKKLNTCKLLKVLDKNETEQVYDITVEKNHEFIANGLRVHNCLAVVYGAEESRISQAMKVSYKEAKGIITSYLNAYPGLKKYMNSCDYEVRTTGKVKTEFGRIRHLAEAMSIYTLYGPNIIDYKHAKKSGQLELRRKYKNSLNNGKNFKIQGLAAHIVNRAAIEIAKQFKKENLDAYIALNVHDQIISIAREDQTERVKDIMRDKMENTIKLSIPLIAEPEIADNLAESH